MIRITVNWRISDSGQTFPKNCISEGRIELGKWYPGVLFEPICIFLEISSIILDFFCPSWRKLTCDWRSEVNTEFTVHVCRLWWKFSTANSYVPRYNQQFFFSTKNSMAFPWKFSIFNCFDHCKIPIVELFFHENPKHSQAFPWKLPIVNYFSLTILAD